MSDMLIDILMDISHYVLNKGQSSLEDVYMHRLTFLYSISIKNLLEMNNNMRLNFFVDEVKRFEKEEIKFTLLYLDDFEQIEEETVFQIFSIVSNQLARKRIQGNLYQHLAYFTEELYIGFITGNLISESGKKNKEILISETILDFDFASCKSDNTSFRLMYDMDIP